MAGRKQPTTKSKNQKISIRDDLKDFYELDEQSGKIRCKPCCEGGKDILKEYDSNRGWTNLVRHLTKTHKIPEEKFKMEHSKKDNITRHFLAKIRPKYATRDCYPKNDTRQVRFEMDLLDFIAIDGVPLDITSQMGFVKMIKNLNGALRIPSRRTIGRRLLKSTDKIQKEQRTVIAGLDNVHLSFDLWTSKSRCSVLGIKIHFLNKEWKLDTWTVGFKHFDLKKTSHNLRTYIKTFLSNELGIQPDQVFSFMADNAAENVKAFNLEEFKSDLETGYDTDEFEEESSSDNDSDDEEVHLVDCMDENVAEDMDTNELSQSCDLDDGVADWKNAEFERLGCNAHALQLIVKECMKSNDQADEVIRVVSSLVNFFHKSNYWTSRLYKKTKQHIVSPGATRWNSIVLALDRIMSTHSHTKEKFIDGMNDVLVQARRLKKGRLKIPDPISPACAILMQDVLTMLRPFMELTDTLQGDSVTSSMVLIGIICLCNKLAKLEFRTEGLASLRTSLCISIVERFGASEQASYKGRGTKKQLLQVFSRPIFNLASVLDPRVKLKPFIMPVAEDFGLKNYIWQADRVIQLLKDEVAKAQQKSDCVEVDSNDEQRPSPTPVKLRKTESIFDDAFDPLLQTSCVTAPVKHSVDDEINDYLSSPPLAMENDPLLFWKINSTKYPMLSNLAKIYLSFPASSGGVERLFSIAGSIARARRARLTIANVEKLLLYREWRVKGLGSVK